jgi:hypothetical protein
MQSIGNSRTILGLMSALLIPFCAIGQTSKGDVQQKLVAKYAITTPNADWTDITTAGSILVLKKDNLEMIAVSSGSPFANTYKDGKLTQGGLKSILSRPRGLGALGPTGRKPFLAGAKMWATSIDVNNNGIVVELLTDAISTVRYRATVTFPYPKGSIPSPEEAERMVGEVFGVAPSEAAADPAPSKSAPGGAQPPAQAPPARNDPAPPPIAAPTRPTTDTAPPPIIAPPPPPSDPAPTPVVALGMTTDQVIAIKGQPSAKADRGAKGILFVYKDVKITLVNGKVTDIN